LWGRAAYEASFFASAAPAVLRSGAEAVIAVTPSVSAVALGALVSGLRRRPLGALVQDLVGNAASESGTTRSGAASMISRGEYALLRRADLVGVITPRFGEIVVHNGVAPERLFALPNFTHIRRSSLDKATARTLLGWPPGRILVVHTGNMGMKQGLETVVDAAAIATSASPGVDFIFVGDGNQRAVLEHRATGLPNVRFVDPLAPEQYPHALAAADILLVNERASVREMSLPSKLTSYLAAGRPVIAAVVPEGITEQAAQHCGGCLVIPAGDPEALLAAVARLGDDTMLAGALAVAGRRFAAGELGADAALGRYANFTQRLLDFSSTAAR
jgi:glycosyltransferase involved in cell wall biosynthesis